MLIQLTTCLSIVRIIAWNKLETSLNKQHTITCTNDDPVKWRKYVTTKPQCVNCEAQKHFTVSRQTFWIISCDHRQCIRNHSSTKETTLQSTMMTSSKENISVLLAICAGNSSVTGEFPSQRPVTGSFDVFVDLRLNKRLSKQSSGRGFETP